MPFLIAYPFAANTSESSLMTWLQFIEGMTGHLVWPTVVVILAFALRRHLGPLAERILELSFGGATVKFGELLTKGTDIVDFAPGRATDPEASEGSIAASRSTMANNEIVDVGARLNAIRESIERIREQSEITEQSKQATDERWKRYRAHVKWLDDALGGGGVESAGTSTNVFRAFEEVENALDYAGEALEAKSRGVNLMAMLARREFVTTEMVELYRSLRTARNAIAHGEANLPNDAESIEFTRQANFLTDGLLGARAKIEESKRSSK